MTGACQMGDCRNRATLTVTVELPADWSESREYAVRTLQAAVCGDCARELESCGRDLLAARVQFARRLELADAAVRQATQLVALIEAVGPPFEPVQGSVFAGWLSRLDKPTAQAAWRLLAHVKRKAMWRTQIESGLRGRAQPAQRPQPARPSISPSPRGGDDAA